MDQAAITTVIWKHIYQVWLERNLARHGKEEEDKRIKERLRCINEISTYYIYRDDGKLLSADKDSTMFYETIQEHLTALLTGLLNKESTLNQFDMWLCTYRTILYYRVILRRRLNVLC